MNNGENDNGELLFGHPVPVTDCPINCCSTSGGIINHSKVQMTGLFRIHSKFFLKGKFQCTHALYRIMYKQSKLHFTSYRHIMRTSCVTI